MSEQIQPYPPEELSANADDGTMPNSLHELERLVVGHRIVAATPDVAGALILELDDGRRVRVNDTFDCCALTEVRAFLLHPELVDHVITGVGTTDGYTTWHVYADAGDVLELTVEWSCGNPFYYGYGFSFQVEEVDESKQSIAPPERMDIGAYEPDVATEHRALKRRVLDYLEQNKTRVGVWAKADKNAYEAFCADVLQLAEEWDLMYDMLERVAQMPSPSSQLRAPMRSGGMIVDAQGNPFRTQL